MDLPPTHESCVGRLFTPLQRAARPRTWVALAAMFVIILLSHPGCVADGSVAIAMVGDGGAPAAEPGPRSALLDFAQQAKDEFRARMNPSAPHVNFANVMGREPTQAVRAYALRSFESAIDALLAEAHRSPEAARAVEAALRRFVARGKTAATDAIFSEIVERETRGGQVGARPAAAIRNSVALAELPAALDPLITMIKSPGKFSGQLGEKARPAYRRAAELDPDEPWTWIAIAWMGEAGGTPLPEAELKLWTRTGIFWMGGIGVPEIAEVESAIDKAEAAAKAGREDEAAIAALHVRARVRLAQGRLDEAERALLAAVSLAEERARAEPGLQTNLALCLNLLGEYRTRAPRGRKPGRRTGEG